MLDDLGALIISPLLRAFFMMLGTMTGVWVRFEKIRGDLFNYRVVLDEMEIKISEHLKCAIQSCTLQYSILDFSLDMVVVSNVQLEGVHVEYTRHKKYHDMLPESLPPFLIKKMGLKDAKVTFVDHTREQPVNLELQIDEYHCDSLHSKKIVFDAIFTANMSGHIDGAPFTTRYTEDGPQRLSQWGVTHLPTALLTPFVNNRSLDLIQKSKMNIIVNNEWMVDEDVITMDVQVLVTDLVNFQLPKMVPAPTQKFAETLGVLLNHQVKDIPLSLTFKVRKDDFMDLASLDATGVLNAFANALTQAIMEKSLKGYDRIWDMGLLGLDTIRDIKRLFDKY